MAGETMSSEERVWAAIKLEKPDRVPIDILAIGAYTKTTGGTVGDFYSSEDKAWAAIDKMWDYTGGWDMDLASIPASPMASKLVFSMFMGIKMALPGVDLPDDYNLQAIEEEILKPEDYDTIAEIGWQRFMSEDYLFRIMDITPDGLTKALEEQVSGTTKALDVWGRRGVFTIYTAMTCPMHPFFRFSLGRSMLKFTEDL
jgi:hypothetical protein